MSRIIAPLACHQRLGRTLLLISLIGLCGLGCPAVGNGAAAQESTTPAAEGTSDRSLPLRAKRIVFLGDSITHSGTYVAMIEMRLRLQQIEPLPEIINVGLSSETCSGLSEPAHPFPRPDVHERLDRVLDKLQPDLVVACYGMNDGIYHPFAEDRFAAYRDGIDRLIEKVHARGAKIVLLTPPPFDSLPLRDSGNLRPEGADEYAYFAMYEDYDRVLQRYASWIMEQHERVEMVIDLHTPITEALERRRIDEPNYSVAPDGIHPNDAGHRLIAETILKAWGIDEWSEVPASIDEELRRRNSVLHDAYLSDIGHLRPGVAAGLPVEQALQVAAEIDRSVARLIEQHQQERR